MLADLYIELHAAMPEQIVLGLDATDIPLYGYQPERFFHRGPHGQVFVRGWHGYYDIYCYLPLCIFAGDQVLCAAQASQPGRGGRFG